ncbi:hypothetical protein EVAR_86087_1 [Eumeta japonica]|uniref:Uncharacterized protein n=1 Tax=Eumeta variegata TaxID=151549 RepID=A0A4C1V1X7_EUMVA|nr:hypothetical protein EVAR_86087_1 [Eumeta japonica]
MPSSRALTLHHPVRCRDEMCSEKPRFNSTAGSSLVLDGYRPQAYRITDVASSVRFDYAKVRMEKLYLDKAQIMSEGSGGPSFITLFPLHQISYSYSGGRQRTRDSSEVVSMVTNYFLISRLLPRICSHRCVMGQYDARSIYNKKIFEHASVLHRRKPYTRITTSVK